MDKDTLTKYQLRVSANDILKGVNYTEDDVVFVSGSLVEGTINQNSKGIGNRYSDIDVFVLKKDISLLSPTDVTYNSKSVKIHFKDICGERIDIENYSLKTIEDSIAALNNCDFSEYSKPNSLMLPEEIETNVFLSFIHRFINGICIFNNGKFDLLKDELNLDAYFRLNKRRELGLLNNLRDDIVGNYDAMQVETAAFISCESLIVLSKAYLSFKKISYDRDKWVFIKLKNLSKMYKEAEFVYENIRHLYFERQLVSERDYISYIECVISFIDEVADLIGKKEDY